MMLDDPRTLCDHYCPICDTEVQHVISGGVCTEPEEMVCDACWAAHEAARQAQGEASDA